MTRFRTKALSGALALAGLTLAPLAFADQGADVDFNKVNSTLQNLSNEFAGSSDQIRDITLNFDPNQSTLQGDSYKIDASMTLVGAPWSGQDVRADAALFTKFSQPTTDNPKGGMTAHLNLSLATDGLVFVKHMAGHGLKQCSNGKAQNLKGLNRLTTENACELSGKLQNAASLDEVAGILQTQTVANVQRISAFITQAKTDREAVQNEYVKGEIDRAIARAEKMLKVQMHSNLEKIKNGFRVTLPEQGFKKQLPQMANVIITVTGDRVALEGELNFNGGYNLYNLFKPSIQEQLNGLAGGESFATENVRRQLRSVEMIWKAIKDAHQQ